MPDARDHSRWLIATFAILAAAALVVLASAIAAQYWLVAGAGALGVLGNGVGLWDQVLLRRRRPPNTGPRADLDPPENAQPGG